MARFRSIAWLVTLFVGLVFVASMIGCSNSSTPEAVPQVEQGRQEIASVAAPAPQSHAQDAQFIRHVFARNWSELTPKDPRSAQLNVGEQSRIASEICESVIHFYWIHQAIVTMTSAKPPLSLSEFDVTEEQLLTVRKERAIFTITDLVSIFSMPRSMLAGSGTCRTAGGSFAMGNTSGVMGEIEKIMHAAGIAEEDIVYPANDLWGLFWKSVQAEINEFRQAMMTPALKDDASQCLAVVFHNAVKRCRCDMEASQLGIPPSVLVLTPTLSQQAESACYANKVFMSANK